MNRALFLLYLSACLLTLSTATAQDNAIAIPAPELSLRQVKILTLKNFMHEIYNSNQFNGAVLVADSSGILLHQAYGWANIETRDTMSINTPVRLASVSKQFTAMAVMQLQEQGKLQYDDAVSKYLPELSHYEGITIRHLLTHASGLPDYFALGYGISSYFPVGKLIQNRDLLKYFSETKPRLNFKPGRRNAYSNTGYVFLALLIERVSGMSYPSYLHKYIFTPAGMAQAFVYTTFDKETQTRQDTTVIRADTIFLGYNELKISKIYKVETRIKTVSRRRAYGYELGFTGFYPLDYHQFDGMHGEKGVCISTADLQKWDTALKQNKLVRPETLREAFVPSADSDRREWRYGFGWKLWSQDYNITFHHGLYRGFRTYIQRNLRDGSLIVVLSNVQIGRKMSDIVDGLDGILTGRKYKVPKPTKVERDMQAKFEADYRIAPRD